ncbi:SAM-dependent methyltransferase [Pseudomonas aeruginosa]|nr:SAM-dependent methyltransferase [Pseudomonas aeruginosa]
MWRRADPLLRWLPGALRTACRTAAEHRADSARCAPGGRRCRAWTSPAEEGAWPLSEHAADVVLLQHGLDFCLSPHRLLREAARTVRPGGHLLLIGINPWSLWGIRHYFAGDALRQARCIPPSRACDWLNLLGFALEKRRFGCYRPPLASAAWQSRLARLERWGDAWQSSGPPASIYWWHASWSWGCARCARASANRAVSWCPCRWRKSAGEIPKFRHDR